MRVIKLACVFGMVGCAAAPIHSMSQDLPPPARTVFKCELDGHTTYTDLPCVGSKVLDLPLSQGSTQFMDRERAGRNGQSESQGEGAAEVPKTPATIETRAYGGHDRVMKLAHTAKAECPHLSQRMALVEAEERTATKETIQTIRERLSVQRNRYRELGC